MGKIEFVKIRKLMGKKCSNCEKRCYDKWKFASKLKAFWQKSILQSANSTVLVAEDKIAKKLHY